MFNKDHLILKSLKKTVTQLGIENRVRFLGLRSDVAALCKPLMF
jgi:hypothetical protein